MSNQPVPQANSPMIGVMGVACRLPGARDYNALKQLLLSGSCAVTEIPDSRFAKSRYLHPKPGTRGKSYTFAAGVVEDIWEFDPQPFGISPREATQMDPQQRILLQVVWEAIEDTGLAHTQLSGSRVGVYVGASSTDHRDHNTFDPGSTDPYMMTGNTMSLIANRISYIFDFNGPSFTVDTACSSSLVALENAVSDLKAGVIDTAVVGGVNALLSPFPFIGFSAATMLSPEGLCRAFDANGKGYVRAEGAAAIVLQRVDLAAPSIRMPRMRAELIAAGTNSDGKTVGVSLPSDKTQGALLKTLYEEANVDVNDLAFLEAHGTGTRVGDPAEAQAIGDNIAKLRDDPLLIGSIKSNIGHLEPAAGLAGLLKAIIAFEEGVLPQTLHVEEPNPDIPFDDLNLQIAIDKTPLKTADEPLYAGVSTFGFGGTNAHAILRDVERPEKTISKPDKTASDGILTLSAHGDEALRGLAQRYADFIKSNPDISINALNTAVTQQRALLADCLSVHAEDTSSVCEMLESFAKSEDLHLCKEKAILATGRAERANQQVAFVFNGNGAQFAGMALEEYAHNSAFKSYFDDLSEKAEPTFGWSAVEMLHDEDLVTKLESTAIAQPLLFIIQMSVVSTLADFGLHPNASFGHSVGEIAAATSAGALSIEQGIEVIYARSQQQDKTRGKGKMAVGGLSAKEAEPLLAEIRSTGKNIVVAAINAPNAITVSGDTEAIENFVVSVKKKGFRGKVLDLDYGFHCSLMDPIETGLRGALEKLTPNKTTHTFVSTVTGEVEDGTELDADYWWRNIREPVAFQQAAETAFEMGCRIFVEIGPRSLFRSNIRDTFSEQSEVVTVVDTLRQPQQKRTPHGDDVDFEQGKRCALAALTAIASGALHSYGEEADKQEIGHLTLPTYAWQNKSFRQTSSEETINSWQVHGTYHMLLGHAEHLDATYWRSHIDNHVLPMLADHVVDGKTIVPGAAYAEMALAAGQRFFNSDTIEIRDMDITRAIEIPDDEMVETHTEISADASSISISSRRRLSEDDWTVNATARLAKIPGNVPDEEEICSPDGASVLLEQEDLYKLAQSYGLSYGPAFSRASHVEIRNDDALYVFLKEPDEALETRPGAATFLVHPTDLDIAFHGLVALYKQEDAGAIKRGFIPIRFGKLRVFKPGSRARVAKITLNRHSPRNISANFTLFDENDARIAVLEDARFRAVSLVKRQKLEEYTYHFRAQHKAHPGEVASNEVKPLALPETSFLKGDWSGGEARLLLEAAAQRISFDTVEPYFSDGTLSTQNLLERGRIRPEELLRLVSFLNIVENAGFVSQSKVDQSWSFTEEIDLPETSVILSTIMREHAEWSAECVMLSHIAHHAARHGLDAVEGPSAFEAATLDHHRVASLEARGHADTIAELLSKELENWPKGKPFRILEIGNGSGGLTRQLIRLLQKPTYRTLGHLISSGSDPRTIGTLRLATLDLANVAVVQPVDLDALIDGGATFDFVVSANGFHTEPDIDNLLRQAAAAIAPNGRLIATENEPSAFHDVLFAYEEKWFQRAADPEFPLSAQRMREEWLHVLEGAGFGDIKVHAAEDDTLSAILIDGRKAVQTEAASNVVNLREKLAPGSTKDEGEEEGAVPLFILESEKSKGLASQVAEAIWTDSHRFTVDLEKDAVSQELIEAIRAVKGEFDLLDLTAAQDWASQDKLAGHLQRLNQLAVQQGDFIRNLWLFAPGGSRALFDQGSSDPGENAIWTYARTLRNEFPDISVRCFDFQEDMNDARQSSLISTHINHGMEWTEAVLKEESFIELVATIGLPEKSTSQNTEAQPDVHQKSTLVFEDLAGVDDLHWALQDRQAPGHGEVEIEVAATGLNFRDVMWTLGVLPDEALEDGFAGPTLGFECAGRVLSVGDGVTRIKVGDPVIALGPACFSSHLTVNEISVVPLPNDMDLVEAATIPVTFLTAYYALHDLARLEKDEWVLIQGGAGGVGLAAIQIAQWCGAKIIATAGTEEKRDFLRTLGVEYVLDSRSLDFVDEVRQITNGEGIDCVLNSLFGEAMERGIELLKPFGRFLELGKRDYYGNTKIGLRPFRRNITYFGIDADQLLSQKPALAQRLFKDLMSRFDDETFTVLPYRKFDGSEIIEAFRLMQKSGHIGKIVVTPTKPDTLTKPKASEPIALSDEGHTLVIGGLGGFGLEIAKWLADKGSRSIVLTSRSGKVSDEQQAVFNTLLSKGIKVQAVACDVSDAVALEELLTNLRKDAPIKGIVHAAMVLRDGLIANMSKEDIDSVLTSKVQGAYNIDHLTREDELELFVLFSSITTFIGNPGQANYVAANGYLEGLARKRRQEGLPAVAVGWGAITDVGYLARNEDVGNTISKRSGTMTFTSEQALSALEVILGHDDGSMDYAALSVAPMDWSVAKGGLSIIQTPPFITLNRRADQAGKGASETLDIAALIEGKTEPEARAIVSKILAKEVSIVLRAPIEEINVKRPLTDLGMDSLMGVELRMTAQQKLGVEIPLASIANGVSVDDIAKKIISRINSNSGDAAPQHVSELASYHLDEGAYSEEIHNFESEIAKKTS